MKETGVLIRTGSHLHESHHLVTAIGDGAGEVLEVVPWASEP